MVYPLFDPKQMEGFFPPLFIYIFSFFFLSLPNYENIDLTDLNDIALKSTQYVLVIDSIISQSLCIDPAEFAMFEAFYFVQGDMYDKAQHKAVQAILSKLSTLS